LKKAFLINLEGPKTRKEGFPPSSFLGRSPLRPIAYPQPFYESHFHLIQNMVFKKGIKTDLFRSLRNENIL